MRVFTKFIVWVVVGVGNFFVVRDWIASAYVSDRRSEVVAIAATVGYVLISLLLTLKHGLAKKPGA